ncbi:MAG TPA: zinc ribbon domain-containing protein [Acidisarcina sp.]|nr:zinc ribbon domain-containing protein [Acidisarcina sp.]
MGATTGRMIRCSACGAEVAPGTEYCSGCGLRLAAYAVPVVARQRRGLPILLWIAIFAAGLYCLSYFLYQSDEHAHEAHRAALLVALHDGSLATPEAFQRSCGQADAIATTPLRQGPVLEYRGLNLAVAFSGRDVLFADRDRLLTRSHPIWLPADNSAIEPHCSTSR